MSGLEVKIFRTDNAVPGLCVVESSSWLSCPDKTVAEYLISLSPFNHIYFILRNNSSEDMNTEKKQGLLYEIY